MPKSSAWRAAILPDERAVLGLGEEPRVDERVKHRVAGCLVEPPQSARLLRRQSQTRHFEKLTAYALHDILDSGIVVIHRLPDTSNHVPARVSSRLALIAALVAL